MKHSRFKHLYRIGDVPAEPTQESPDQSLLGPSLILPPDWSVAYIPFDNPIRYPAVQYGRGLHQSSLIRLAQNEPAIRSQRSPRSLIGHPSNTPLVSIATTDLPHPRGKMQRVSPSVLLPFVGKQIIAQPDPATQWVHRQRSEEKPFSLADGNRLAPFDCHDNGYDNRKSLDPWFRW